MLIKYVVNFCVLVPVYNYSHDCFFSSTRQFTRTMHGLYEGALRIIVILMNENNDNQTGHVVTH